jgi:probable HAF family extracellular repeat protein
VGYPKAAIVQWASVEGLSMKTHCLYVAIVATLILSVGPTRLSAQREVRRPRHQYEGHAARYKLFDLGTLGGPNSSFTFSMGIVNTYGDATGFSDSATPTSPANNLFACLDSFVSHAFLWRNGHSELLPDLSEAGCSIPLWINVRREVVGISENGVIDPFNGTNEVRAVVWRNGQLTDLGTLGGNESITAAINERGQIVGWAENNIPDTVSLLGGTQTRAVLWQAGTILDLGTLGGPDALANHINERGQVVGDSFLDATVNPITGFPTIVPFLWDNGVMKSIGSLGGTFGEAFLVNNRAQVLGDSDLPGDHVSHPTFWENGNLVDLAVSSIGGSVLTGNWLNEKGAVVGAGDFSASGGPTFGGALWHNGAVINIDTEDASCGVEAWGLNNLGQAVGTAKCGSESHAWLWNQGHATDLNTLVPSNAPLHLVYAVMISDGGEIVGMGVPPGVSDADVLTSGHAFVLLRANDDDDEIASSESPVDRSVSGPASSRKSDPPTKEAMMQLHNLLVNRLRPLSLQKHGLHGLGPVKH